MITATVLNAHNVNLRILLLDSVHKAIAPVDTGAAGLVVHHKCDIALPAYQLGHLVGGKCRCGNVVGRRRCDGDIAVDTRVESHNWDLSGLSLAQERNCRLAVESREADRLRVLGQSRREHVDLLVDHGLAIRPLEGYTHVVVSGGLFGACLHGLPELVLKSLRDERDVDVLGYGRTAETKERADTNGADQRASAHHSTLLDVLCSLSPAPHSSMAARWLGSCCWFVCSFLVTREAPILSFGGGAGCRRKPRG